MKILIYHTSLIALVVVSKEKDIAACWISQKRG
jgi:hypothetical protein